MFDGWFETRIAEGVDKFCVKFLEEFPGKKTIDSLYFHGRLGLGS